MADYYISPTGDDTTGDGSFGSPWKSLAKADSYLASPGDTLYCRGGTYTSEDDGFVAAASGTSGSPITVRNYTGETPVFRAITHSSGGLYGEILSVYNRDYVIFDGLEFRPNNDVIGFTASWPFYFRGTGIVFRNCVIAGHLRSSDVFTWTYALIYARGGTIDIDSCDISGSGDTTDPNGNSGQLLLIQATSAGAIRVHDCTLSKGCHDCCTLFQITTGTVEIVNNTFENAYGYCVAFEPNVGGPAVVEGNDMSGSAVGPIIYEKSPVLDAGDDHLYRFNAMHDCGKYGIDLWQTSGGHRFCHNVVWNMDSCGIIFLTIGVTDVKFFNNVIAHNMQNATWYVGNQKSGEITNNNTGDAWPDARNLLFHNNFICCYVSSVWEDDYQYAVYDELYVRRTISWMEANKTNWTGNIYDYSDPNFTDAPNGDFTIASGSSLINQGRGLTTITSVSGSGTSIVVEDARWFWFSEFDSSGDQVIIDENVGKIRAITAVDYGTNTITLDGSVSWSTGDSVNIYKTFSDSSTVRFSGAASDIGVDEYIASSPPGKRVRIIRG